VQKLQDSNCLEFVFNVLTLLVGWREGTVLNVGVTAATSVTSVTTPK